MNDIKKLLEDKEAYPPSEDTWRKLLEIVHKKRGDKRDEKIADLQERMQREVNKYRPSLPEPLLARFLYNNQYYYLCPKGQIYEMDSDNPMVGNHVGEISSGSVYINKDKVFDLQEIDVNERTLYERQYYVDGCSNVYRGFHPNHTLVFMIGKLTKNDKIDLI